LLARQLSVSGTMSTLMRIDWASVFVPSLHIGEIIVRGTIVYLFLFVVLRLLRRQAGALGIADLLVVVLIADAAQNAMAGEYRSITEGLVLVSTIVFWDFFLNWLDFKFPRFRHLLQPAPLLLIKDGQILWHNLRRQLITEHELMSKLREQGIESVNEVKKSYLEGGGNISVITYRQSQERKVEKKLVS
jgi:uncharacterized membrane protein YcaP (DUF421 family)